MASSLRVLGTGVLTTRAVMRSVVVSCSRPRTRLVPAPYDDRRLVETKPKVHSIEEEKVEFDLPTHTGQAWDKEDYRLVRFTEAKKEVNPNIAMYLIAQQKPISVDGRTACCDGGGGALGHPKVFINLDKPGNHSCGYCGLRFYKEGQPNDGTHHIQV